MSQRNLRNPEPPRGTRVDAPAPFALQRFRHHLHVGETGRTIRLPAEGRTDDDIAELEGRIDDIDHAVWMILLDIDSDSGDTGETSEALRDLRLLRTERARLRAELESFSRNADRSHHPTSGRRAIPDRRAEGPPLITKWEVETNLRAFGSPDPHSGARSNLGTADRIVSQPHEIGGANGASLR